VADKTFDERLDDYEEVLDEYITQFGLNYVLYNKEVEQILLLTYEQIENLDSEGCDIYSYLLSQYSLIITKEINRHKAKLFWAQKQLELIIANQASRYTANDKYIKYELLCSKIILADSSANALNRIMLHANGKVTQLENVSAKIDLMSRTLSNLARSKNDGRRGNS
jgi:hypothetical protein